MEFLSYNMRNPMISDKICSMKEFSWDNEHSEIKPLPSFILTNSTPCVILQNGSELRAELWLWLWDSVTSIILIAIKVLRYVMEYFHFAKVLPRKCLKFKHPFLDISYIVCETMEIISVEQFHIFFRITWPDVMSTVNCIPSTQSYYKYVKLKFLSK